MFYLLPYELQEKILRKAYLMDFLVLREKNIRKAYLRQIMEFEKKKLRWPGNLTFLPEMLHGRFLMRDIQTAHSRGSKSFLTNQLEMNNVEIKKSWTARKLVKIWMKL